uniref:Uncharacterized protein n=1 Tax=Rhizophora mucronata TaxID=61149 RepID=A0A2P2P359_RHIMU
MILKNIYMFNETDKLCKAFCTRFYLESGGVIIVFKFHSNLMTTQ